MKTKTIIIIIVAVLVIISIFIWGSDIMLNLKQSIGGLIIRLVIDLVIFFAGWILGRRQLKRK